MSKNQESKDVSKECRICGESALYSYYGVIACQSCKTFFRRGVKREPKVYKCDFDGHCEVNLNTRHVCSYCRFQKCFASGMQRELIRASRATKNKPSEKRKEIPNSVPTTSTALVKFNQLEQFPVSNLLQSSQSILTVDQWNLLSNLSHCYDEYNGLAIGERFMQEQNLLPPTMRFQSTAVFELFQKTLNACQLLYKNNRDFVSLSSSDRSILLHRTFKCMGNYSSSLITSKIGLISSPAFLKAVEIIANRNVLPAVQRLANQLDFDMIVVKLFLAIISFSTTTTYTVYSNVPVENLSDIREVLRIQNTYIELLWRYLLYRYDYKQAIKCFSDLIRSLFGVIETVVKTEEVKWLADTFDSLVQLTELDLIVDV